MSEFTRIEALDRAVRVSLARGGQDTDDEVVKRASAYDVFLQGENVPLARE